MNLFEKATKMKLRFNTDKGVLSLEDIWDLHLTSKVNESLDTLYKKLHKKVYGREAESIITTTKTDSLDKLRFDIVVYIIEVKLKAKKEREKYIENKEKKEKIMSIIAVKQDESLINADIEDLEKMLKEL